VEGQLIQSEEAVDQIRIVVEITVESSAPILIAVEQTIAVPKSIQDEICIGLRNSAVIVASEISSCFGECAQHKPVPIRQDLFVASGLYALFPNRIEFLFGSIDLRSQTFIRLARHMQDIGFLPIA